MAAIQHTPLSDAAEFQSGEYSILAAMPLKFSCKYFPHDADVMLL